MQILQIYLSHFPSKNTVTTARYFLFFHLFASFFTDNKEYDAYLSYTKVDLDSLGRLEVLVLVSVTTAQKKSLSTVIVCGQHLELALSALYLNSDKTTASCRCFKVKVP